MQAFIFINKIKNIIIQILDKLHNNNYAHTDIKPENILIDLPRLESKILYEQIYKQHDILKKNKRYSYIYGFFFPSSNNYMHNHNFVCMTFRFFQLKIINTKFCFYLFTTVAINNSIDTFTN